MNNKYELKFQRNLLLQFSNSFNDSNAVIAELIANSYDANSSVILINIDTVNKILTIEDDGIGMNDDDIKNSFLTIGSNKRQTKDYSMSKRKIMGRKGNGRLGVFSFANKMNVTSRKNGYEKCNVVLDLKELINDEKNQPYSEELSSKIKNLTGTKIVLSEIEADLNFIFEKLDEYISMHFSHVLNKNDIFKVKLFFDDKEKEIRLRPKIFNKLDRFIPLSFSQRDGYWDETIKIVKNSDLVFEENDLENGYNPNDNKYRKDRILELNKSTVRFLNKGKQELNHIILPPWSVECKDLKQQKKRINFNISGWIGTLSSIEDKEKKEKNVVNHGLIVYARNRVVISNMLKDIKTDRFYQSYIVGEIFAEDLDHDELIDIINISRDNFSDQDERFSTLKRHILSLINLLIHEKEKIKRIKRGLKTELTSKTTSNIITKLKEKGIKDEIIKTKIAPVFAKETNYKMTSSEPTIFISYMSIEKSPTSFHMSKIIYEIFKFGLKIEDENVTIIYTGSIENGVPFGEDIMQYLKENALATYLDRVAFIACVSERYTENWYTSVEYGASWVTGKKPFILIDNKDIMVKFKSPLAGINFIDFSSVFNKSWEKDSKFVPLLLKLVKDILKTLKIKNIYADLDLLKAIRNVISKNPYEISTTNGYSKISNSEKFNTEQIQTKELNDNLESK